VARPGLAARADNGAEEAPRNTLFNKGRQASLVCHLPKEAARQEGLDSFGDAGFLGSFSEPRLDLRPTLPRGLKGSCIAVESSRPSRGDRVLSAALWPVWSRPCRLERTSAPGSPCRSSRWWLLLHALSLQKRYQSI
jgi:hypothetical protein